MTAVLAETPLKRNISTRPSGHQNRQNFWFAFFALAPALIVLIVVIFVPLVQVITYSVHNTHLMMPQTQRFVGLDNFNTLFRDPTFLKASLNTFIFTISSVFLSFLIGFALALVLNERVRLKNIFRGLALIPWVIPGVAIGLMALYMFNGQVGIINYVLKSLGLIEDYIPWFGSTTHAMPALIATSVWNQTPFYMLMLLAGLQSRPDELMEAAKIDGAGTVGRFFYVTLPHLTTVIMIITALMVIWNFNNFDVFWATTQGGPVDATTTLAIYTYRQTFQSFRMGYASAIAVIWIIGLMIFAVFYTRALGGFNHD
jgi:multiple sugar transport system permease protein